MKIRAAVTAAALALATPSYAFIAQNGMIVEGGKAGFSVPYTGRSGPRDFWCAAGDFAVRQLGLPKSTRIYRTSPPPRRSGEGMTFGFDRSRATKTGLIRFSRDPGLTVAFARHLCERADGRR